MIEADDVGFDPCCFHVNHLSFFQEFEARGSSLSFFQEFEAQASRRFRGKYKISTRSSLHVFSRIS